jgi:hypothetical protein
MKRPSANFLRRLHGCLAVVWLLIVFPGLTVWKASITFLIIVNIYSNVVSHLSAHHSLISESHKRRRRKHKNGIDNRISYNDQERRKPDSKLGRVS